MEWGFVLPRCQINMKVAVLASNAMLPDSSAPRADQFELMEQMNCLIPACKEEGIEIEAILWNTAAEVADQYTAVLPLFVWDYVEDDNTQVLFDTLEQIEKKTILRNTLATIKWNSHKGYLNELAAAGAPTIPTKIVKAEELTPSLIEEVFETFGSNQIVIKPTVGANAWRQVKLARGDALPPKDEMPPEEAMIQPFLESVKEEGEFSFHYFGNEFSHAVQKKPAAGDYRIQSTYGGKEYAYQPSAEELELVQSILSMGKHDPLLYVRVDLLRGADGGLRLIELEVIEPYLYMPFASSTPSGLNSAACLFAKQLRKMIEQESANKE